MLLANYHASDFIGCNWEKTELSQLSLFTSKGDEGE